MHGRRGQLADVNVDHWISEKGVFDANDSDAFDRNGRRRVVYRPPNWQDYVHVAFMEIRACGAANVQIARRLRAMLENLFIVLPPYRHAALEDERRRLDHALELAFSSAEDLALARIPDSQGLGGSSWHKTMKHG